MKLLPFDHPPRAEPPIAGPPLFEPGTTLSDLLAALAARMTSEQRAAFNAKMAAMDFQKGELWAASVTLGRA